MWAGAPGAGPSGQGSILLFERPTNSSATWSYTALFYDGSGATGDGLGTAVAVTASGGTAAAAAPFRQVKPIDNGAVTAIYPYQC